MCRAVKQKLDTNAEEAKKMRLPHTWPLLPFFPSQHPLRWSSEDGGNSGLGVIILDLGVGVARHWALPQKPQTDSSLYRLSGRQAILSPVFPERPGRSREEQGECSERLDTSSPPLGCRELESQEQGWRGWMKAVNPVVYALARLWPSSCSAVGFVC